MRWGPIIAMIWFAAASAPAAAQTAGAIAGRVQDTSGAVMPGVTVEASSPALIERVRTVVTDDTGQYKIIDLRPGVYTVTFSISGFSTVKREGIELTTNFTAVVNAVLTVGELAETITVSGQSPVVDIQNVSTPRVMTRAIIDAIPTGKQYSHLGQLIPGISIGGSSAAGHDVGGSSSSAYQALGIHGGRIFDQMLQIDGMTIQIMEGSGGSSFMTVPDSNVEEITFNLSAHSAELETGGIRINTVPRSGGNTFSGSLFGNFTDQSLNARAVPSDLVARGFTARPGVQRIYDVNPSIGGPIERDRLWFYAGYRKAEAVQFSSVFYDTDPTDWKYVPDTSRDTVPDEKNEWNVTARVTWQMSPRNKLAVNAIRQAFCYCEVNLGSSGGARTFNSVAQAFFPTTLGQGIWTATLTNRLLVEAQFGYIFAQQLYEPEPGSVGPPAIELNGGWQFRSKPGSTGNESGYPHTQYYRHYSRASLSYVTGAHAFKVGTTIDHGIQDSGYSAQADYNVILLNAVPVQVQYLPTPFSTEDRYLKVGLFAQDQWTLRRLTVNAGLRFDEINTGYPANNLPATNILPARSFPAGDVLHWLDLSPRLGVAYDLFGNGKTAIKASVSRYVAAEQTDATKLGADPAFAASGLLTRNWNDVDHDYIPDGDPLNPAANGELGPSTNVNFGKPVFTTVYDPAWSRAGFGGRFFNWEFSTGIQHEVMPGMSVDLGYFRRIYGNFPVTYNRAVGPADYDPYCVTAPRDARLPGGGGQQICGLFDLNPAKVGQVNNVRTLANNFGVQREHFNGVDLGMNARLARGILLQGGVSTGKTMTDNCDIVTKIANAPATAGGGPSTLYCHNESPFLTEVKFLGSYMLPGAFQLAATYLDVPAPNVSVYGPQAPGGILASGVFTNAQIAPSLGRNLSSSPTATVWLIEPNTLYGERARQLDLRVARTFSAWRTKTKAIVDFYNVLNARPVLALNTTYGTTGASWLTPTQILIGRLVKFGVQVNF